MPEGWRGRTRQPAGNVPADRDPGGRRCVARSIPMRGSPCRCRPTDPGDRHQPKHARSVAADIAGATTPARTVRLRSRLHARQPAATEGRCTGRDSPFLPRTAPASRPRERHQRAFGRRQPSTAPAPEAKAAATHRRTKLAGKARAQPARQSMPMATAAPTTDRLPFSKDFRQPAAVVRPRCRNARAPPARARRALSTAPEHSTPRAHTLCRTDNPRGPDRQTGRGCRLGDCDARATGRGDWRAVEDGTGFRSRRGPPRSRH